MCRKTEDESRDRKVDRPISARVRKGVDTHASQLSETCKRYRSGRTIPRVPYGPGARDAVLNAEKRRSYCGQDPRHICVPIRERGYERNRQIGTFVGESHTSPKRTRGCIPAVRKRQLSTVKSVPRTSCNERPLARVHCVARHCKGPPTDVRKTCQDWRGSWRLCAALGVVRRPIIPSPCAVSISVADNGARESASFSRGAAPSRASNAAKRKSPRRQREGDVEQTATRRRLNELVSLQIASFLEGPELASSSSSGTGVRHATCPCLPTPVSTPCATPGRSRNGLHCRLSATWL